MRRNKTLFVGAACAACCAACVGLYTWQVDSEAEAYRAEALERYGGEQIDVCVATRDIAAGETIGEGAVEVRTWVAALLPEGAIADRGDAVGQVAGSSILKGEVVTAKRLGTADSALEVPEGLVAVSVPAHDVQAIGGALAPGMRADVYAIGPSSTTRLLSDVLVVATSASSAELSSGSAAVSWVTVAVAPASVEELISAAENLELYFVLPNGALQASAAAVGGASAASAASSSVSRA